jgi:hypothetical protein
MDNKNLKGQQDRSQVAGNEDYEMEYLASQLNVSKDDILKAIKVVGNSREKIEAYFNSNKNG